jgi:lipopolysaccharide transport system ATP-binding protein
MANDYYIHIKDANLSYPSAVYNGLSLKQEVFRLLKRKQPSQLRYDVHALKGITLDIHEGEKVGVIGRNGSGKTTLLKAIAGLYPLQSGVIETAGRIRSMFELNVGFEPEATGRENITYRGLLLGETPKSIREKEAEIIAFADIGDFIDYPLKAYSSGMIVRLAFAISTAVRGNILLMDETLAAGDAAFQEKARNRMTEIMNDAKILVIVSHDMNTISRVCNRVLYLKKGEVVADGPTNEVIKYYLDTVAVNAQVQPSVAN